MPPSDVSAFNWRRQFLIASERSDALEMMDGDGYEPAELRQNFRDIRRVNQLLGGTSTILHHLPRLLDLIPPTKPVTMLDLATGSADIPAAIADWAKKRGCAVSIVASDSSADVLALARVETSGHPDISLARYDARAVPLPDKSFDIVLCSLSLHHFGPDDAVRVLREMDRLARIGFILNDLRRSRSGYAAAWAAARLTTRNRLTRNDAPLSVRRAYTPVELRQLLRTAGVHNVVISKRLWFRMAAVSPGVDHDD